MRGQHIDNQGRPANAVDRLMAASGPAGKMPNLITVEQAESGQKLLSCLQRRLAQTGAQLLHKWIRTGQIRRNGCRAKPFERVDAGDVLRLPPFAFACLRQPASRISALGKGLAIIGRHGDILAINKPAGLPSQGGSGHSDSVAARLWHCGAASAFRPVPAHRLDMETSGLLLAAASYQALLYLQQCFRLRTAQKHYLAWVEGRFQADTPCDLYDFIGKARSGGHEKMVIRNALDSEYQGAVSWKEAFCRVRVLRQETGKTLLHVLLGTGRKHQIRAQLAARGHPVLGDVSYGAAPLLAGGICLHSARIVLPDGVTFEAPPPWGGDLALDCSQADIL